MNYRVEWGPVVEDHLAAAWVASPDRAAVAAAAHRLDMALSRHPLSVGETRESSVRRVAFDPLLGIEFEVVEDDKRVAVQGVFRVD